jgi:hypothetical protein
MNSQMSKTTSEKLRKLIKSNKTEAKHKTHVSMIQPKASLVFNRQTLENVFESIQNEMKEPDYIMGMAEKSQPYMSVIADIDLKVEGDEPVSIYNKSIVKKTIKIYQDAISEIIDGLSPQELTCVFLAKEPYTIHSGGDSYVKHGFHIHFPYIFMSKISQENHLLPKVQSMAIEMELFETIGCDSKKAIDKGYLSAPWLMYGSRKDGPEHKPYLVKYVFNSELKKISLEEAFENYKIYDDREHEIDIKGKVEEYLPRILSIVPYGRNVKEVKPNLIKLDEIKIEERKAQMVKNKIYDQPDPEDVDTEVTCRRLLNLVKETRAYDYNDWMTTGWILNSVFKGSEVGLELWKEFSQRCPDKYDECIHDTEWERMDQRTDYSMGTLHYWAKTDNPINYKRFINEVYGPVVQFDLQDEIPWSKYNFKISEVIKTAKDADDEGKNKANTLYEKIKTEILKDLNRYFAVINGTAKPYFMIRQVKKDNLGIKYIEYIRQTKQAFKDSYENKKCWPFPQKSKGRPKKPQPWIDMWLDWDNRRTYENEVFQNPSLQCPNKLLNIFHGFNISRELANEKGTQDVSHFFDFIKTSWCNGNEEESEWVINWFAHSIQNPIVKMLSAIVLRGEEGIGKGMVVQKLAEIIGPQFFIQPASIEDVLGTFNGIVANKAIVFLDEMVWGGDKQKSGVLKKLITESKSSINEKNLPQRPTTTVFNLIISSNEDWIVPAGNNARRYMMLDVQNTHSKEEKDKVRLACPYSVAKFLYDRDITGFEHNNIIATSALASQKEQSAPDAHKFIIEQIKSGELPFEDKISFETLYTQFKGIYPHNRFTRVQTFAREVKKIINYKIIRGTDLKRRMKFPSEEECRKSINAYYRQDMFSNLLEEETEE